MIISTLNIRQGGGSRVDKLKLFFKNSDILILTEFRNNKNKTKIKEHLSSAGYKYFIYTKSLPRINTIMIASKYKFEYKSFAELNENKHRIIKISINGLAIYGCYFPQKNFKKPVFKFLLNELKKNNKVIIIGDFNTGKHYVDEVGKSFYCSGYLYDFENNGMIDAWRLINKNNSEFSWYSNSGNGFRIDHCYVSKSLENKIKDCWYNHRTRKESITDHSMLSIELNQIKT